MNKLRCVDDIGTLMGEAFQIFARQEDDDGKALMIQACAKLNELTKMILNPTKRLIKDMVPGEVGYVVPWVYDRVNTLCRIHSFRGDEATRKIVCVSEGTYTIQYEEDVHDL